MNGKDEALWAKALRDAGPHPGPSRPDWWPE